MLCFDCFVSVNLFELRSSLNFLHILHVFRAASMKNPGAHLTFNFHDKKDIISKGGLIIFFIFICYNLMFCWLSMFHET